jgi:hypothetical protein
MRRIPRAALAATLLGLALVALAGCFNPFDPRIAVGPGISTPKPEPNSPTGVMELFRWCYENRALAEYRELFTDDYVFVFGAADSAGNQYRDEPWRREDELIQAQNLFIGGSATEEAATSIQLEFTNTLRARPDSRPGKNARVHRELTIDVVLRVNRPSGSLEVKGAGVFFVVRGDSALIPGELGFDPDSNRWYIERWEDRTVQTQPALALRPAGGADRAAAARREPGPADLDPAPATVTFGQVKARYRH